MQKTGSIQLFLVTAYVVSDTVPLMDSFTPCSSEYQKSK